MTIARLNVVIVGVDGSAPARAAASWAADEASRRKAELHLIHAYSIPAVGYPGGAIAVPELRASARATGQAILDEARAAAQRAHPDLVIATSLHHGLPVDVLRDESEHALALVVGTAGCHEFVAALLGSVATRLAGHAHCPVIVVRSSYSPASDAKAGSVGSSDTTGPVVIGLDGTESCEAALAFAFEEASLRARKLVAVHSWDDSALDGFLRVYPWLVDPAVVDEVEHRVLAEQMSGWPDRYPDVEVESLVVRGKPENSLTDTTAAHWARPSLIVVGTRGGGRFTSVVVGSTSHALLADAPCPVAVVRGQESRPDHHVQRTSHVTTWPVNA